MCMENKEIVKTSKPSSHDISFYTVQQKRGWALTVEELQPYIDKGLDWNNMSAEQISHIIPLNKDYEFEFPLNLKLVEDVHRSKAYQELEKLLDIKMYLRLGDSKEQTFNIFNSIERDGKYAKATMSLKSLRWFLDFGRKKMFVSFHKPSFLKLTTGYSMNLFLLLSENYKRCVFDISIEDFRKRIGCPESYDADKIKNKILLPARKEYQDKQSAISFDAEFYSKNDKETTPGRKRLNMIKFMVLKRNENGKLNPTDE